MQQCILNMKHNMHKTKNARHVTWVIIYETWTSNLKLWLNNKFWVFERAKPEAHNNIHKNLNVKYETTFYPLIHKCFIFYFNKLILVRPGIVAMPLIFHKYDFPLILWQRQDKALSTQVHNIGNWDSRIFKALPNLFLKPFFLNIVVVI